MSPHVNGPNNAQAHPFRLELLTPGFEPKNHKVYLDLLLTGLDGAEVRNVALTGAYGTGKSSVLVQLAQTDKHKALNISLSSMGLDEESTGADDQTLTNRIQKEIVKQILYTVDPRKVPRSRFDRIARPRWYDGLTLAGAIGIAVAVAVTYGRNIVAYVGGGFPVPWLAFTIAFLATGAVTYIVTKMMRGRVSVNEVTAGPAKIALSRSATSYFDQYLDEILYIFEVTRYNLVIFEDIDRFDDTGIFEALRSLNTMLNSAPQLAHRPIRFVYAMRDSLFQKLEEDLSEPESGTDDAASQTADASRDGKALKEQRDTARRSVERANRTKFFDLVIPVVPFITRENARDLMTRDFRQDNLGVSDRLLNIVARHIADMRLITNIRNEFKVFHHHLIAGLYPVPELDADKLLAIVVYKNVHLTDFEAIRLGESNLDALYQLGRELVTETVQTTSSRIQASRDALARQDAVTYRSKSLGRRLELVLSELGASVISPPYNQPVGRDVLTSTDFWRDVVAERSNASLRISQQSIALTPQLLGRLLNEPLPPERWDDEMRPRLEREIATLERAITSATRATWSALHRSPTVHTATGETFATATRRILGSDLAADLVQHGYLDEYFSLNIAPFYAEQISRNAMNFVQRNVDRGVPDLLYALSGDEVEAILSDRPHSLEDVGIYNVAVLDHLLTLPGGHASKIIDKVPAMGTYEAGLLRAYVEYGSTPREFIKVLAPLWPAVFAYLVEDTHVDFARTTRMMDAALKSWSNEITYDLGPKVRAFIGNNYSNLSSLSGTHGSSQAASLAIQAGVVFGDLTPIGDAALTPIKEANAYPVTVENLARLTGLDSFALDRLAARDKTVHAQVLKNLSEYLTAIGTAATVESAHAFLAVLKSIKLQDEALIESVVARANPDCVLANLEDAPPDTWAALASHRRVEVSVANLAAYLDRHPVVDAPLATLLTDVDTIISEEEHPRSMVVVSTIVGAAAEIPDSARRIQLVDGIHVTGHLALGDIPREATNIVSLLLAHDLVEDAEETFALEILPDPNSFAAAVTASKHFSTFMTPVLMTGERIASLMHSDDVDDDVKHTIVTDIRSYVASMNAHADAFLAVANYCRSRELVLNEAQLNVLRDGLDARVMAGLLAQSKLEGDALVRLLHAMGGVYSNVSTHGRDKVQLPDDETHVDVARRLKDAGVVSSFRTGDKGHLDVWRRHGV